MWQAWISLTGHYISITALHWIANLCVKVVELMIHPRAKAVPWTHNVTYRMCATPISTLLQLLIRLSMSLNSMFYHMCNLFNFWKDLLWSSCWNAKYASVTYWHVFMDSETSTSPSVIYFFEEKDDLYWPLGKSAQENCKACELMQRCWHKHLAAGYEQSLSEGDNT